MLPYLSANQPFPPVSSALTEPDGLLAAGGDLSAERLIQAYSMGIFPWYSTDEPIMWWSPDPRTVFFIEHFKVHKSVLKTLKRNALEVTINRDFAQVINQCALPREQDSGTWITDEMIFAYNQLHRLGHAHSIEVWQQDKLVGGLYGVATGGIFCGESMFSRISNGSKIALSCLIKFLKKNNFLLLDCQVENPHLMQLGAKRISRKSYLKYLANSQNYQQSELLWQPQKLDWQEILSIKKVTHVESN